MRLRSLALDQHLVCHPMLYMLHQQLSCPRYPVLLARILSGSTNLEKLLQKIVVTNYSATLHILKEEEFVVESFHSLDNTDLKEISKCAPFVIDVHYSF